MAAHWTFTTCMYIVVPQSVGERRYAWVRRLGSLYLTSHIKYVMCVLGSQRYYYPLNIDNRDPEAQQRPQVPPSRSQQWSTPYAYRRETNLILRAIQWSYPWCMSHHEHTRSSTTWSSYSENDRPYSGSSHRLTDTWSSKM